MAGTPYRNADRLRRVSCVCRDQCPKDGVCWRTLRVTGTSIVGGLTKPSLSPGFSTDIVLHHIKHTKSEVGRKTIVVQEDGTFSAAFDTKGLAAGDYTVEIIDPEHPNTFGGSSKTLQFLKLIDRSGDLRISSPLTQELDGSLDVSGAIDGIGGTGVQIQVKYGDATVYGPEYIRTDADGRFSDVPYRMQGPTGSPSPIRRATSIPSSSWSRAALRPPERRRR